MRQEKLLVAGTLALGLFAFAVVLAYHRIADGDLWARLAVGRHVLETGKVMRHDLFAFTPTLPEWIDHEWGAGVIFYALWNWFGPGALMVFKIAAACVAILLAIAAGRRRGTSWPVMLLLAIPCAVTVLPGYVTVVRSHALTYLFFALTLLCLEAGRPILAVPVMLLWANVHGGFVVGLIAIAAYAVATRSRMVLLTLLAALAMTLVNPCGLRYWSYLVPAWLHPRADITEWGRMPVWGIDPYFGFRILFVVAIVGVVASRKQSWPGLALLALTAGAGWLHMRHAPFFGIATLVYLGPCLESKRVRLEFVSGVYVALAAAIAWRFLPAALLTPATPEGFYPVRAVQLMRGAEGNLAVPFRWGSYASWELWPGVKISMDGRYEEVYPDATFEMNHDFFFKQGKDWDRLLRQHRVDFVILELRTARVTLADLRERGFELVWSDEQSALLQRGKNLRRNPGN